ncbi:hypothetical protein KCU78_g11740, partial [Aureobasidium melanogenum]
MLTLSTTDHAIHLQQLSSLDVKKPKDRTFRPCFFPYSLVNEERTTMANNFMLKLLIIFFGCLNFFGAVAQISKKPDAASSAVQDGGYQASTLLTSVINKVDIVPHDLDASNAQSQPAANTTNDLAEMDNDEVLSDAEEEDDDDESLELMDANVTDTGDVAMSSASKGGKRLKARLVRYHKAECEKKRHPRKGKKMKEGKCHRLDKNHFKSYEFCIGKQKKDKKGKDDDDADESDIPSGCRMMIFFDKKCKDEASSTNAEESCKDIGEEGVDDDDDDDDKDDRKLHARDLMGKKGKGPKYKSAKFLCDGVDTSENTKKTETEDDYYVTTSVSSQPVRVVDPTGSYSKSYTPSSITATRSTKSATCKTGSADTTATAVDEKDPDDDDDDDDDDEKEGDDKEDDDKEDDKEDDDEDKETSSTASQTTKTKKHKTKSHKSKTHTKSKKHHSKTRSISATQSAQATSDSQSP